MLSLINRDLVKSKLHTLSITKMFGIPVIVEICCNRLIVKLKNVFLECRNEKIVFNEKIVDNENESHFMEKHIHKMKLMIDDLKYNKLTGRFELEENEGPNICALKDEKEFYDNWGKENKNIEITDKLGECSVCFEDTLCKSNCGHFLCYDCWSKIKFNECEDCESHHADICDDSFCGRQTCPTCREVLFCDYN